jgi:hypothetical protein
VRLAPGTCPVAAPLFFHESISASRLPRIGIKPAPGGLRHPVGDARRALEVMSSASMSRCIGARRSITPPEIRVANVNQRITWYRCAQGWMGAVTGAVYGAGSLNASSAFVRPADDCSHYGARAQANSD